MDTQNLLNGNTEKTAALATNLTVLGICVFAFSYMFNMPILADDVTLAHANIPQINISGEKIFDGIMNEISPEVRQKNFDKKMKEKFPKAAMASVAPGVKYVRFTRYYDGRPVRINLVEIDRVLARDYELKPALSSTINNLHGKRTITTIAKNTNSIVAINGGFFKPQTGVPLGTLMINEKIYTGPVYDRVALGIFDDGFQVARVQMNGTLSSGGKKLKIDNINQPRMLSTYAIAYTSEWGQKAPTSPKYGWQIAVKDNKILSSSFNPLTIPEGGYVIVAPLVSLKPFLEEEKVEVDIKTTPEWKGVRHIISGGPYLVRNGDVFVDMTAQKLASIGGKNPRTAVGYTLDNDLIMVTVDGREGASVGMTLMQLARFMKEVGCVNAINLDGGGSTVMYVNGQVVNHPAYKGGIALSNALVLSKKTVQE